MNEVYVSNHNPRHNLCCDIRDMLTMDLPKELYQLDVLDGSPPCSTFSMAGNREKDWGKEKKFKEGQKSQVLDTLFFDFIALAKRLQPKVVVAENVKGMLLGNAIDYVRRIHTEFDDAGYYCQHFLLDASTMGVPQRRERVVFLCLRKDLASPFLRSVDMFTQQPYIDMGFNEKQILYGEFADDEGKDITGKMKEAWDNKEQGDYDLTNAYWKIHKKRGLFNCVLAYKNNVCNTLAAHIEAIIPFHKPKYLSEMEVRLASTFPTDYDFLKCKPYYICGMSVPPVMMAQIANRVWEYWLKNLHHLTSTK